MFVPSRILFEKNSLNYEMGNRILDTFRNNPKVEIINMSSNRIKGHIPGDNIYDFYR